MSIFTINQEKCKGDGICVSECPARLIELKDGSSVPTSIQKLEDFCIKCGHCVAICPTGAFSYNTIKSEDCPPLQSNMILSIEETEHFFRSRRSVRQYQNRKIENEKLTRLIEIARYAPTGSNRQQVKWIILNSQEKVRSISRNFIELMRELIVKKDPFTQKHYADYMVKAWESGLDTITRGAPALIFTIAPKEYGPVDSIIALSYLDLAAQSFGLGTCWAGYLMFAISRYPEIFNGLPIPDGYSCFGILMIGYPKYKYQRLPGRNEAGITRIE